MSSVPRSSLSGNDVPPRPRKRSLAVVTIFAVSVTVSLFIFGVGVSQSVAMLQSPSARSEPLEIESIAGRSLSVPNLSHDEYRAIARELDRKLIATAKTRKIRAKSKPDAKSARASWEDRVNEIRRQLWGMTEIEKGTIAWHRLQELKELQSDPPLAD